MTERRRLVRVPASSANLGPGYDVLAAALALELELEVSEVGEFAVDAGPDLPTDRSNLCVRAFERLHPADGLRFEVRSEIPLARGLGSSAAAIVAGLVAADHLYELGLGRDQIYSPRGRDRGPPRQRRRRRLRRASCSARPSTDRPSCRRQCASTRPREWRRCWWSPTTRCRPTRRGPRCRRRSRSTDAVANVAAASQLVLGIERSDLALIARGLADRLHQPARRSLYERSMELVGQAHELGRDRGHDLRRRPGGDAVVRSGRTPARWSRPPARPSAAGPRYGGCRSRRWEPTCPSSSLSSSPSAPRIAIESE